MANDNSIETATAEMLDEHAEVFAAFLQQAETIQLIGRKTTEVLARGGKILACGNGGSASQADHFAGELVGRFRTERCPLPGIALSTSPSTVTAIGNDYGYDETFARQVEAYGREGDLLLALSTSGNSPNVIKAVERARERGIYTAALAGKDGGALAPACDAAVVVASQSTGRIQEMHILAIHIICEMVDRAFDVPE